MALKQKVSWTLLKTFLKELISSFESSKQLNEVLLEELQLLHSPIANDHQTESTTIGIETEDQDISEHGSVGNELNTKQETANTEKIIEMDEESQEIYDDKDEDKEMKIEQSDIDKNHLNEITDAEFHKTLFEEEKEDITIDEFMIEDKEKYQEIHTFEEATSITLDKSNDPDFGSDIGANMDNDEKDTENDSHSEIIDFDDHMTELLKIKWMEIHQRRTKDNQMKQYLYQARKSIHAKHVVSFSPRVTTFQDTRDFTQVKTLTNVIIARNPLQIQAI